MSASDFLKQSSVKCCCCRCSKLCQNIGSLLPDCTSLGEMPEYYTVTGFCGGVGPGFYWPCCTTLETSLALLMPPASGCVYSSAWSPMTCNNGGPAAGLQFRWELDPNDGANPVLKLIGSDGTVMVWRLPPGKAGTWSPLCSAILYRRGSEDYDGSAFGDPTYCYPPPRLCLNALGPCCPDRTDPLPRTLHGTFTQQVIFGGPSCPCGDGATISLNWNNVTKRWYGSAAFCGGTMEMEIWCFRQIPQTGTFWRGRLKITSDTNASCNTNAGVPPVPVWQDFSANTSGWDIAECDPIHLRTHFSFDGCCGHNPSGLWLDITE